MDVAATLASSAAVAAVVGGAISFLTQRYLLDRKARVDYRFNALRRLHEVVGPLRLQLLLAARDIERRIAAHPGTAWNMNPRAYYVSSFIYRLLRPLAVGQLIERQLSVADFSVDEEALGLIRFQAAGEELLTGGEITLDHPEVDWATQSQHLFRDELGKAAARLIVTDGDEGPRVIDYAQFRLAVANPATDPALRDLAAIFARCRASLVENPIFWLRLVGYGYACNQLIASQGQALGFDARPFATKQLLAPAEDEHIRKRLQDHVAAIHAVTAAGL